MEKLSKEIRKSMISSYFEHVHDWTKYREEFAKEVEKDEYPDALSTEDCFEDKSGK